MTNFIEKVKEKFESAEIFDNENNDAIVPINYTIKNDSKILFVAGTNASGKSLVGKIVEMLASEQKIEKRSCSMRNRASSQFGARLIFGSEDDESTGDNSVHAAMMGLKSTIEAKNPAVLILDEPDIGLADEYTFALGEYIANQVNENNDKLALIVVISHSRNILKTAIETLNVPYSSMFVGNVETNFEQWLEKPVERASLEDLLNIKNRSLETWRKIEKLLKG